MQQKLVSFGMTDLNRAAESTPAFCFLCVFVILSVSANAASIAKRVLRPSEQTMIELSRDGGFERDRERLLTTWNAYGAGYRVDSTVRHAGECSVQCRSPEQKASQGVSQTITIATTDLTPIVVGGWSRAEGVSGAADGNYSVYVDLIYRDGTPLWGQTAAFSSGSHDWEYREVMIVPEKPVRQLTVYGLFRGHSGTVWFDDFSVRQLDVPDGAVLFDGTLITRTAAQLRESSIHAGSILIRDVAANSDFFLVGSPTDTEETRTLDALKLSVVYRRVAAGDAVSRIEISVTDQSHSDRAISLYYETTVDARGWRWWDNVQESRSIEPDETYGNLVRTGVGATGNQSLYPFACIASASQSLSYLIPEPRVCRMAYDAGQQAFFVVFDLGLSRDTKIPGRADVQFLVAETDPGWSMRATAQLYYEQLPEFFDPARVPRRQGNWMAFTKISSVERPDDFGFAVHEGNNDVRWDNDHGIQPFVYVEPMTFWMSMPPDERRTPDAVMRRFNSLRTGKTSAESDRAWAVQLSGLHAPDGQLEFSIRNTPWCNGAVFATSADPDVPEDGTHLNQAHLNKKRLEAALSRAEKEGGLAGVYLDSLEGWGFLQNWRRSHWKAADLPLTFDTRTNKPVLLNIMATYEFTVEMARWMRGQNKRLMANSVPHRFPWLANPLDLMGTETNWLQGKRFVPPSADALYLKRTMAWHKPYMFLMNTHYDDFGTDFVERYMQRCLFYGMFPGFFSEDASTNPYFGNPKWYNRDRHLFKKYMPIVRRVAEAGWEPVTLAASSDPAVWIERFGVDSTAGLYFTVMNTTKKARHVDVRFDARLAAGRKAIDLLAPANHLSVAPLQLDLQPEQVCVVQLR